MFYLFFIVVVLIALVLFCFLYNKLTDDNSKKYSAIFSCLGTFSAFSVLLFLAYQATQIDRNIKIQEENIKLQKETLNLSKRPYIYCNPTMVFGFGNTVDKNSFFGGVTLELLNEGDIPATIKDTKYLNSS